ncbi:MAG: hypothetical protein FWE87_01935, partial [Coriobacteriia bacterium]|nr:hypothetical protein [Coriobacteriia bacterium]
MKRTTQLSPSVITPQKALILALFVLLILFASSLSIAGAASGPDVIDLTDPNNPGTVSSTWTCGAGGNDYTVFGDTTVIGFVYDEEVSLPALSFAVSEDVTLHWQAYYVGIAPIGSALVTYTGLGTFQVEDGELLSGWISNMGTGAALRASGSSVIVSGTSSANCGMISANSASAILGDGPSTTVTIKGYGSVFGDERSNLHSVINMTNESNIGTNVIISDNGSVYAIAEATMGYAIQTYGNVLMYGGRVYTLSSAGRGINLIGANSTATINGGKVYVDGGPSSTAISTATTTPATVPSASVIINGGEVSATAGYAIRTTGVSSVVEINGGIVSATTGNAVRSESTSPVSAAVNITDGFVFAYSNGSGDRITGGGNVIFLSGGLAPAIARPAVVCSLNTNAYPLPGTFIEGTSTGLTFVPAGASATWATGTPNDGIDYSNDTNTGFFPLTDVTVAALTNFGLVFDVANQTLLVDVDGSLTPTAADIICPGQGETWTASDSILYLNDFSWNTPARVVLSVYRTSSVLYPAEINLSGVNELISSYEGAEASYGITTFDGVVIFSGYGDLTVTSGTSTDSSSTGINAAIEIYVLGTPTLTVTGGDAATSSRGIDTDTFSLDKGTVVATGTTAEGSSSGLVVGNALYLEGGSLTAIGGDAPESYGIECPAASSLNINSGHLIAEGGTLAISNSTITVNLPNFYKWRGVIYPASLPEMIVIYPGSTNQPYIHGDPFNYVEIMSTRMAVVGDKTVSGFVGRALPGTDTATITLYGDELAADLVDLDVSSWFVDLPTGVVVLANGSEGGSSITLTFSGTPTEVSDAVFDISIPASVLASGVALHLDSNA